jgi:UDP-glucose 4-epimerase
VADLFLAKGFEVVVVDDLSTGRRDNVPSRARLYEIGVNSPEFTEIVRDGAFDVIAHLAAQMDVRKSVANPVVDATTNILGTLTLMEALRQGRTKTRVIFSSTGGVLYGDFNTPPNVETYTKDPESPYAIAKLSTEYYLAYYGRVHNIDSIAVRIGNVYGPRQLISHNRQGFIGWFIRLAIEDRTIQIYGDGSQLRDFVYVDDAADAFLRAGANDACNGEVFNVGGDQPISHRDLTTLLVEIAGSGRVEYVEWPKEKKAIDIGDFYADSTKFTAATGWSPTVKLADGLRRAVTFYRQHFDRYVDRTGHGEESA